MNEETYLVKDSAGVFRPETIDMPDWSLSRFFIDGGMVGMILLSLFLIALLLAAWKAPNWVKETGLGALVLSAILAGKDIFRICELYERFGGEASLYFGGLRLALIPFLYGLIIYFISLIIRVIQKPRA